MSKISKLQILMPMAGRGTRFNNLSTETPKPLVLASGYPLFLWALKGLESVISKSTLYPIYLDEYQDKFDRYLHLLKCGVQPITIKSHTSSPIETLLFAEHIIDPESPLLVLDSDLYFNSDKFCKFIQAQGTYAYSGAVLFFKSELEHFSYTKIDNEYYVLETAEKRRISNHALAGCYFFTRAETFFEAANQSLKNDPFSKIEKTVAPLYNYIISKNGKVKAFEAGAYLSLGTPEELMKNEDSLPTYF